MTTTVADLGITTSYGFWDRPRRSEFEFADEAARAAVAARLRAEAARLRAASCGRFEARRLQREAADHDQDARLHEEAVAAMLCLAVELCH